MSAPTRREHGRTLVAGVGNIFFGDDGFGVEVVRRLAPARLPDGVDVVDYGIRGVHLAYALLDGRYDTVIIVDALPSGEPPGTLTVLRPEPARAEASRAHGPRSGACPTESYANQADTNAPTAGAVPTVDAVPPVPAMPVLDVPVLDVPVLDAHGMSPDAVLGLVRTLGGEPDQVLVVGCQPAVVSARMGLSGVVSAAVDDAVVLIDDIVRDAQLVHAGPGV
jgi:hydrogenase maturation protease